MDRTNREIRRSGHPGRLDRNGVEGKIQGEYSVTEADRRRRLVDAVPLREEVNAVLHVQIDSTRFLCPFHDDRVGALELIEADRKFRCIVCEAAGDVVDFVRLFYRVSLVEAMDMMQKKPEG